MPKKPYGTSVPFCASCMCRCGMTFTEIDQRLGERAAVHRLRSHLRKIKDPDVEVWLPERPRGGWHNDSQGLYACHSSAGMVKPVEGVKMPIQMFEVNQPTVIGEVARAFWKMDRIPFAPHQWERLERYGYKPAREYIEKPKRPIQTLL